MFFRVSHHKLVIIVTLYIGPKETFTKVTAKNQQNKAVKATKSCFLSFRSDQSLSCVQLFATPWIAARQASLSITNSWSSLSLMSIESAMPSSHLILCHPLLLLPPIPPSISLFQWVNSSHDPHSKYIQNRVVTLKYFLWPHALICSSETIPPFPMKAMFFFYFNKSKTYWYI